MSSIPRLFRFAISFSLLAGLLVSSATSLSGQKNLPKVDLNTGLETALASLPGVGDERAARIVGARPYTSVDDLTKAGLTTAQIEKLRPFVVVTGVASTKTGPGLGTDVPGSGITPVPVAGGGMQSVPVPAGTVKTITVPKGAVQKTAPGKVVIVGADGAAPTAAGGAPTNSGPGLVWVDSTKKVFYRSGAPQYGKVNPGIFMTEATALARGHREAQPAPKAAATKPKANKR